MCERMPGMCFLKMQFVRFLRCASSPEGEFLGMLSPAPLLLTTWWASSGWTRWQESRAEVRLWETRCCILEAAFLRRPLRTFSSFAFSLLSDVQRAVNEARLEGHFGLSVSDFRNSSVWWQFKDIQLCAALAYLAMKSSDSCCHRASRVLRNAGQTEGAPAWFALLVSLCF